MTKAKRSKRTSTAAKVSRSLAALKGQATRRARREGKDPARVWGRVKRQAETKARGIVRTRERAERRQAREHAPGAPVGGRSRARRDEEPEGGGMGGGGGSAAGGAPGGGQGEELYDPGYDDFGYIDDYYGYEADEETEY